MGTGPCPLRSSFVDRQRARKAVSTSGLRGREGKRERRWKRRRGEGKGARLRGRVGGWEIRMEEEQKREDGRERRNEQREGTLS